MQAWQGLAGLEWPTLPASRSQKKRVPGEGRCGRLLFLRQGARMGWQYCRDTVWDREGTTKARAGQAASWQSKNATKSQMALGMVVSE